MLIEIVDYCLGSDSHTVYDDPVTRTIGWYGLELQIGDRTVARRPHDARSGPQDERARAAADRRQPPRARGNGAEHQHRGGCDPPGLDDRDRGHPAAISGGDRSRSGAGDTAQRTGLRVPAPIRDRQSQVAVLRPGRHLRQERDPRHAALLPRRCRPRRAADAPRARSAAQRAERCGSQASGRRSAAPTRSVAERWACCATPPAPD